MRCKYCMPSGGIKWLKHEDILSYEEITEITQYLVSKGITKVRLTGGEPLVRKDIEKLVEMLSKITGIHDLSMTTNGILLGAYADKLKSAGLNRVNISLDTLNPLTFQKISPNGSLADVLKGIDAALKAELTPVKINCVDSTYNTHQDIQAVKDFGAKNGFEVRVIHQMNLPGGIFTTVEGGQGGKCRSCNRLRMSSDGKLIPCLFSNLNYDIKALGIDKALELALKNKPQKGINNQSQTFYQLGG